jgi:hypothetical protein
MWSDPFAALLRYLGLKDQPSVDAADGPLDSRVVVEPIDDDAPASRGLQEQLRRRQTLLIILALTVGLFVWWTIILTRGGTFMSIGLVALATLIGALAVLRLLRGPLEEKSETITPPVEPPKRVTLGIHKGETLLWQSREHPMVLANWWVMLVLTQIVSAAVAIGGTPLVGLVLWVTAMISFAVRVFLWNRRRICVTDQRIFVTVGWIQVDYLTMPLNKVTDLRATSTRPSTVMANCRVIKRRYVTLIFESAGQDQALSSIKYVPNGMEVYRLIMSLV